MSIGVILFTLSGMLQRGRLKDPLEATSQKSFQYFWLTALMFKNLSVLGAFGEFVYKAFCESRGMRCQRTNYCHTDFLVTSNSCGLEVYVDVKSTQSLSNGYRGKRFHSQIVYDTIVVREGMVRLIPDAKSPHFELGPFELGTTNALLHQWQNTPKNAQKNKSILSEGLLRELRDFFVTSKYPRMRLIERGDASAKRWTGTVDNLPGSARVIDGSDVTVFVQYGCHDFKQAVSTIMLFPHELFRNNKIRMAEPCDRQRNKGITKVVDLKLFASDFPELVFSDVESLKHFVIKS